jgi:20S proteasome alpha/beta subunit
MTLLVFVRCQDGCVLASDRKATSGIGFGQEETKSRVFRGGWAVAGAGDDGSAVLSLFTALEDENVTVENVHTWVADKLESYNRTRKIGVKCIVLAALNGTVDAHIVETSDFGSFDEPIVQPFKCVGEVVPAAVAQHYLRRRNSTIQFANRSCVETAPEILAILKFACEEGSFVGRQEDYGLDMILFQNGQYCWKQRVTDVWALLRTDVSPIEGIASQLTFEQFDGEEQQ